MLKMNRRGQVAIFVIIALVIVLGIFVFMAVNGQVGISSYPKEFEGVYSYYSQCIRQQGEIALGIAESQGGRIYVDSYVPGSEYAPFSNQLNFLGFPVPYWFYVSGNGVVKENVPTISEMETDVARYIQENLGSCSFDDFSKQGMVIEIGNPTVGVKIKDNSLDISVMQEVNVESESQSAKQNKFDVTVDSSIGKLYKSAVLIYDKQKNDAFLENYSIDVLRLYAPVDGVEIGCSPKTWVVNSVFEEIKKGLEANIAAIKFKGGDYELTDDNKYFVVNHNPGESVNLMYNKNWPTKIEVYGEEVAGGLMSTAPVGTEEGLGILGFCYLPYHFVYDLSFPVLVQVYNGEEIFQFPVIVVIDKNFPRNGIYTQTASDDSTVDLCNFLSQDLEVAIYDTNLNNINGNVSYKCFDRTCNLGESKNGLFSGKAPACINGYLKVSATGYSDYSKIFSTTDESSTEIILDREYEVDVQLRFGGNVNSSDRAIINFVREDGKVISSVYPESRQVKLSEGNYKIKAYVYGNSSVVIPASTKTQCQDVPKSGLLGFFGATKQECFNINLPETKIDYALTGGGNTNTYLLESQLQKGRIIIGVSSFGKPNSIQDLQYNFEAFENQNLEVDFG